MGDSLGDHGQQDSADPVDDLGWGAMLSHQGTKRLSHRFLGWLDRDLSALELPRRYPFSLWKLSAHIDATVHDV